MIEITAWRDRPAESDCKPGGGLQRLLRTVLPDDDYDRTWRRLMKGEEMHGLADLFVDETVRGRGSARVLIEAVAAAARARGCPRFYWLTKQDNACAGVLYDKVARFAGFIRYDYPMVDRRP